MRIIAGEWRGRRIEAPAGRATRPTSDRTREGLFSMLASRLGSFEDLQVADLYAGSGALGLEALSRGAANCTFVERDPTALAALRANIERLGAGQRAEIRAQGVEHAAAPRRPCDLVVLDPPYGTGLVEATLTRIAGPGWLAEGALVSAELHGEAPNLPPGLWIEAERRFGKATILLLQSSGAER